MKKQTIAALVLAMISCVGFSQAQMNNESVPPKHAPTAKERPALGEKIPSKLGDKKPGRSDAHKPVKPSDKKPGKLNAQKPGKTTDKKPIKSSEGKRDKALEKPSSNQPE